jgi:endonuclease/exonuclease/phosphatase family metal-dependent hydrolase/8-oxo-dGTP pyrophosphatase MutT (NUDIX family)
MLTWLVWVAASMATCESPQVFDTLTVSSWNTWGLPAPISKARKARFERINSDLERSEADLVALQEVWGGAKPLLPKVQLIAREEDSGLAFVSPKRKMRDIAFHPFVVNGRFEGWKTKGVLAAISDLDDGTGLLVLNTHFQAGRAERWARNRASDTDVLLQAVAGWAGPVLVAGDFNFYAASPTDAENVERIWDAGFEDVAETLGVDEITFRREHERFDRIYLRGGDGVCLRPLDYDVTEYQEMRLSDHQRVMATIEATRDGTQSAARYASVSVLLREYHRRHDERDWAGLASLFDADGDLAIHGTTLRARGPTAIEDLFAAHGPDDRLILEDAQTHSDDAISVTYRWARDPDRVAGEIYLLPHDGRIRRLDVYPLPGGPKAPQDRPAVRALVVAPGPLVLLLRCQEPTKPGWWWITPGGGRDEAEDDRTALRRELREELGLDDVAIGPCVWTRSHTFVWRDRVFRQHERFHLVETAAPFEPVPRVHDDGIGEHRWWSLEEMRATRELLVPRELPRLLASLLEAGPPATPEVVA